MGVSMSGTSRRPIPYGRHAVSEGDIDAVVATLRSDFLTQGPKVAEFEAAIAAYTGAKYAVAVANGTAGLHLAALALGVDTSTRVITTPITFAASANCIRYCGGSVAFADIDPETLLIDLASVERLLESKPRGYYHGLVVIDFAGRPLRLDAFRRLADRHGLWILEDACHALGGHFVDDTGASQRCGNAVFADAAVFSCHPVKHVACGEGGVVTTNSRSVYEKVVRYRSHGITKDPALLQDNPGGWYYEMQGLGFNYRLSDIHAALGSSQLSRLEEGIARREAIATRYDDAFRGSAVRTFGRPDRGRHAHHLYVVEVPSRREVYDALHERGVLAQVHYVPLHTMPYYRDVGFESGALAHAEAYYERALSLPMYPTLTDDEQAYVIDAVLAVVKAVA